MKIPRQPLQTFGRRWLAVLVVALGVTSGPARGQTIPVGDVMEEYLRVLQVMGRAPASSFMVRPLGTWRAAGAADSVAHPWSAVTGYAPAPRPDQGGAFFGPTPARVVATRNSALPVFYNDGALWQGRGFNVAVDAGAFVTSGPLRVTVRPIVTWSQNQAFDLAPVRRAGEPEYAHPWRVIDVPQRMGTESYSLVHPGESAVEVAWKGGLAGVSSRSLWWGPGQRTSILMSNHAPGVPHAFVGTDGPVATSLGSVEAQWIWGWPRGSEFYDGPDAGRDRFLTGLTVAWSPRWVQGLSFGASRTLMVAATEAGLGIGDYLSVFSRKRGFRSNLSTDDNPSGGDPNYDQLVSLSARYLIPPVGLEVYLEWARNDSPWDWRDLLMEPDHSSAYLMGFTKAFALSEGRLLAFTGETSSVAITRVWDVRPTPNYYDNGGVRRGYTNEGQILGSALGVGGAGHYLAGNLYSHRGRLGAFVERRVIDNDYFYPTYAPDRDLVNTPQTPARRHHIVLSGGTGGVLFVGGLEVGLDLVLIREWNRYYELENDFWNLHSRLGVTWRPSR